MSSFGEYFRILPEYSISIEPSLMQQDPISYAGRQSPLSNLSMVKIRMDFLHHFLSQSLDTNTLISEDQMDLVSSEIASAVQQIIVNGAALLSTAQKVFYSIPTAEPKPDNDNYDEGESKIIDLDAVELLSEHLHFCEICGKGFQRDANLRMHIRAHGDQYKTPEAPAKKTENGSQVRFSGRKSQFSCPYGGCTRNKNHDKFRPLKSVTCARNHFKRSHCPKMYGCNRCHEKRFSILADLRNHSKHCVGEAGEECKAWKCSCGNCSFCGKEDKLFRHVSLFEGHNTALEMEEKEGDRKLPEAAAMEEEQGELTESGGGCLENGLFDGLFDGFGSFENYCLQDLLGPS